MILQNGFGCVSVWLWLGGLAPTKGENKVNTMTRAHFQTIAEVVETLKDKLSVKDFNFFVLHLGNRLSQYNDNFDSDKFEQACGLSEIVKEISQLQYAESEV
jgi:hypothetical protein